MHLVPFITRWIGPFWLAFYIIWWAAAFSTKRSVQRQTSGSRLLQSGLLAVGIILIFNLGDFVRKGWLARRVTSPTESWVFVGAALTLLGWLIAFWARATLGGNWSGRVTIKQDHQLVMRGPYTFVRHPIYTGLLLGLLGTAFVYGYARCFIGLLICLFSLWLKSQTEERFMLQQFGQQYLDYRSRVRALVPFVL